MRYQMGLALVGLAWLPMERAMAMDDPQTCMAKSMYYEAREGGRDGMVAVGWVILNRMADPQFPPQLCDVVREGGERPPCQFSWWCDGKSDRPDETNAWALASDVAAEVLAAPPADPTDGALFFHTTRIDSPWPGRTETTRIGNNVFYR